MSRLICVVGRTGTGKTFYTKNTLLPKAKRQVIYDVYNEYESLRLVPFHEMNRIAKCRVFGDFEEFIERLEETRNKTIVIEDATIFLNMNITEKAFKNIVISRRHSNNMLIFLFHSLNRIPKFIIEQMNYLVLFRTMDTASVFSGKFRELPQVRREFSKLLKSKRPHQYSVIEL